MKAYREDRPFSGERRGVLTIVLAAAAVLVLAALLYFGLSDSEDAAAPASLPVVRDSAAVVPPLVDTTAPPTMTEQTAPATDGDRTDLDLTERPLAAPRTAVGAGAAPSTTRDRSDSVVISGELLEDIEAEAEAEADAAQQ